MPFWPDRFHLDTIRSGTAAAPFVGALDTLIAQGATLVRAYSQRRLLAAYTGPADILRGNGSGSPETTINYLASGGYDLTAAAAAAAASGGSQAYRKTWYDQSGGNFHATQTTPSLQPPFTTSVRSKGAIGGLVSTDGYLNFTGGLAQPFFVFAIVTIGALANTRYLVGSLATTFSIRATNSATSIHMAYGSLLTTALGGGNRSLGFLASGASSKIYVSGVLKITGNTGTNSLPSFSRIGSSGAASTSWFIEAGSSISEFIIFNGNPTGLAGWSAFETAARAYYA